MDEGTALLMILTVGTSFWTYLKLNKFFGAVLTILTSIGIMYAETTQAWAGWIIFSIGLLMLLESVFSKPKTNNRRY